MADVNILREISYLISAKKFTAGLTYSSYYKGIPEGCLSYQSLILQLSGMPLKHKEGAVRNMVEYNDTKALFRLRTRDHKIGTRLRELYATKLDAIAARTYSDDVDILRGALSAPFGRSRPGMRDDAVPRVFNGARLMRYQ